MTDYMGRTALMFAAIDGYEGVVRLLLNDRSEVNAIDAEGNTALMLAVKSGHEAVVRTLLAACPDLGLEDAIGKTPLQVARNRQAKRIAALLNDPPPCR
jgi:ankyrin repeat protein